MYVVSAAWPSGWLGVYYVIGKSGYIMETGETYIADIEKIVHGGVGLARFRGHTVLVRFVLGGEKVRIRITGKSQGVWWGEVVDLLETSVHRRSPACPLYGRCGGCDLQHIDYERQLEIKRQVVTENLARTARLNVELPRAEASRPYGYRNRVVLHRKPQGELGFHERRSKRVIPVDHCPVAAEGINRFLQRARRTKPQEVEAKKRVTVFGDDHRYLVAGQNRSVKWDVKGRSVWLHLNAFFQSNLRMLDALVEEVCRGESGESCVDLYGGIGLYSAFLVDRFDAVTLVENNKAAVKAAAKNVPQAYCRCQDVDNWVRKEGASRTYDTVVANPPRKGLSTAVREYLNRSKTARIVYISCEPSTLARDLEELTQLGSYALEGVRLFDMYPQTAHVETVAKLVATKEKISV